MALKDTVHSILELTGSDLVNVYGDTDTVEISSSDPSISSFLGRRLRKAGLRVSYLGPNLISATQDLDAEKTTTVDLKKKIKQWREYAKENANSAGFRKAKRGTLDPRVFARQLAGIALGAAKKHGSVALTNLARSLMKASSHKNPRFAEAILSELSTDRRKEFTPKIQKPQTQGLTLETGPSKSEETVAPSTTEMGKTNDSSWSSENSRSASLDLVQQAAEFLQEYVTKNGIPDQASEKLADPSIYEAWLIDLESKGQLLDEEETSSAWQEAQNQIIGEEDDSDSNPYYLGQDSHFDSITSGKLAAGERSEDKSFFGNTPLSAPGGDWANTIMGPGEKPDLDNYTQKIASKDDITKALGECLDHFSGEMLPSEISEEDVRNFMREEFPNVSWKEVYKLISKISEPRTRHEDEETDKSAERELKPRSVRTNPWKAGKDTHPLDFVLKGVRKAETSKVICSGCHGKGESEHGTCSNCAGSGRTSALLSLNSRNPNLGLKVAIDLTLLRDRQKLSRYLGTRLATNYITLLHSKELMNFLHQKSIPFATLKFKHPLFKNPRNASVPWKAVNWKIFQEVPWNELPWAVRAAAKVLNLTDKLGTLTLNKFVATIQKGDSLIQERLGRTASDLIREINDYILNTQRTSAKDKPRVLSSQEQKQYLQGRKASRTRKRINALLEQPPTKATTLKKKKKDPLWERLLTEYTNLE
jgi:hypothetical protein